jgi:hypothetical protein
MVVLGSGAVSYERGTPVGTRSATTIQAIGREECVTQLVAHNPQEFYRHDM